MKKINEDIKNNNILPFYLIYSEEDYLLTDIKNKFIKKFDDGYDLNLSIYNDNNYKIEELMDKINTNPFFADKKLIVIEKIGLFNADVPDEFINALQNGAAVNVILFVESNEIKKNNLYEFIKDNGYVSNLNITSEDINKFIIKKLKKENIQISQSNANYNIDRTGNELYNVTNEVDKLISFLDGREVVEKKDIDDIITVNVDNTVWDLINAINNSNTKLVFEMYSRLILLNVANESIFSSVKYNYRQLLNVKDLVDRKKTTQEIIENEKMFKLPKFVVQKIIGIARNTDINFLYHKIDRLSELTKSYKTGDISNDLAVELLLV